MPFLDFDLDIDRRPFGKGHSSMSEAQPIFLYVEDDFASRQVMKVLITRVLGFPNFTLFENSQDMMTRVGMLMPVPTVIFLDVQMKPHDGYEVLKMLRSDSRFAEATIVSMTANVMSHDVEQLKQVGFNALIGKPIVKDVFPQLVERILTGEAVWYVP